MSEIKFSMKVKDIDDNANKRIMDGYSKGRSQEEIDLMQGVMDKFHNVDTHYENPDYIRVQGYIYVGDLPELIPEELEESNKELTIQDEKRVVVEIWAMNLYYK